MISTLTELQQRYPQAHVWAFGDSAEMADELAQLVIAGHKTASCSSYEAYQLPDGKAGVGDFHIVLDGRGEPACVIRTTRLTLVRFNEVSPEQAAREGEGDKSLGYWRQAHQEFFERAGCFSEEMELVFEEFMLVEPRHAKG